MITFSQRHISVTVNIGKGDYGNQPGENVTLEGYRVAAQIVYWGGGYQASASIRVYGVTMNQVNDLTKTAVIPSTMRNNTVIVGASVSGGQMATLYNGSIISSYGVFNGQPDVCLMIHSKGAGVAAVKPVNARSYVGTADAADIAADIAKSMGLAFENSGVSVILDNPYFPGTDYTQLKALAKAAPFNFVVDRGTLAIWPKLAARTASPVVTVSAATGLIGYPDFSQDGIIFNTLMNPNIGMGTQVHLESDLIPACGDWSAYSVIHSIESEIQGGPWFTEVQAHRIVKQ